jgi:uncharacterized caspase-like protein
MRKANVHDEGAMSLAGAIRRAAEAVAAFEKKEKIENIAAAARVAAGKVDEADSDPKKKKKANRPLCRLRWLDLGGLCTQVEFN